MTLPKQPLVILKFADAERGGVPRAHGIGVGRVSAHVEMLAIAMRKEVTTSKKIHTDDTVVPMLEKDRKTTKQTRPWVYGNETLIAYENTPNRSREGPGASLKG